MPPTFPWSMPDSAPQLLPDWDPLGPGTAAAPGCSLGAIEETEVRGWGNHGPRIDDAAEAARHVTGVIFNIQHYSLHDGPGIRTTVFLKGCPLRCSWCHNPESQSTRPEVFFDAGRCLDCPGVPCVYACPAGAIGVVEGRAQTDRRLCATSPRCGLACVPACPRDARAIMGRAVSAGEIVDAVVADAVFYEASGGGLTLSGGEPVAQPHFARSLLKLAKEAGLHTTLDTCGYARWETMRTVLEYVDLVLYDFKHMDPEAHREQTGVPNELILSNARRICRDLSVPMVARVPIIPGCNDSLANIRATAAFLVDDLRGRVRKVHLIPFQRLGEAKYARLERPWGLESVEPPTDDRLLALRDVMAASGLDVVIGG